MAHKRSHLCKDWVDWVLIALDSPRECRPEMILTALPYAPVRLLRAWPSPSLQAVEAESL